MHYHNLSYYKMSVLHCKCGKSWNTNCSFLALPQINQFESKSSFEDMLKNDHYSGFKFMTPTQRREYISSGKDMIKSSDVHGPQIYTKPPTPSAPSEALLYK